MCYHMYNATFMIYLCQLVIWYVSMAWFKNDIELHWYNHNAFSTNSSKEGTCKSTSSLKLHIMVLNLFKLISPNWMFYVWMSKVWKLPPFFGMVELSIMTLLWVLGCYVFTQMICMPFSIGFPRTVVDKRR